MPGLIDLNFNLQDPGNRSVENLETAIMNAARGGITQIAVLPYTHPVIDSETTMEYLHARVAGKKGAKLSILASATLDGAGEKLSEQAVLYKNGALACHIHSCADTNVLRRTFEYAWMQDKTLFVSCRNPALEAGGVMSDGEVSSSLGLPSIIALSQSSEVARVCEMARYLKTKTLIQNVSTRPGVELIRQNKKTCETLYAEVGIDHLILNDHACDGFNTLAKIYPPLEDEATRLALLQALKEGTLDIIATHHTAKSMNSKDMPFDMASFGIHNADYYLPLLYTFLVKKEGFTLQEISRITAKNPAKVAGLPSRGVLKEGHKANLLLFDPKGKTPVSDAINAPYRGMELSGAVRHVIVDGELIL
jgi:dihydroorotase